MRLPRRKFFHLAAAAVALPIVPRIARAQTYPSRPVTLVVPIAAGGGLDTAARILAEKLGCATIHADHRSLHPALVAEIRESGYPLLAYTVNDPARAYTLFCWGVTSVFSDVPHIIRAGAEAGRESAAAQLGPAGKLRQGAVR